MSKKKKTIGELLEEALVPEEKHPYELPDNWTWVNLKSSLNSIQYGYTETSSFQEIGPKFLRITDIQDDNVNWESVPYCKITEKELQKYELKNNDIVVARTGATTGKSYLISEPPMSVFASYLIRLRCKEAMFPKYLWEFMKSPVYWKQITVVKKGSAQPGANAQILGNLSVPLPPLNEQKRIAEKLERLLTKTEEAKQLVKEAKGTFERSRVAILDKAFRGELTEKWRRENSSDLSSKVEESRGIIEEWKPVSEIPNTWAYKSVGDICVKVTDGTHDTPKKMEFGKPYITAKHIREGMIDFDNCDHVSEEDHKIIYARCNPEKNDILVVNIGAGTATAALVNVDFEFSLKNVALLKPDCNIVEPKYLEYYLRFVKLFLFSEISSGGAQPFLSLKKIKMIPIVIPPLQEQKIIVKKLNAIFLRETLISTELEELDVMIDSKRIAILSKAFRGELGTNDPSEESAIELFKEVLQEQVK